MANIQGHSNSAIAEYQDDRAFNFFGLPREIRDQTYNNLTVDIELSNRLNKARNHSKLQVTLMNVPIAKLLTLSHRFKVEYESQMNLCKFVLYRDMGGGLGYPRLENSLNTVKTVHLHLLACSPGHNAAESVRWKHVRGNVESHREQLGWALNGFEKLERVFIQMYLQWYLPQRLRWSKPGAYESLIKEVKKLTEVRKVCSIEVYLFSWTPDEGHDNIKVNAYERHDGLMATWTKEGGWQER